MKMFVASLVCCLLLNCWPLATASAQEQAVEESVPQLTSELRQHAAKYAEAFNKQDTETLSKMWAAQGDYQNLGHGLKINGAKEITETYSQLFSSYPKARLAISLEQVKAVTDNVARGEGSNRLLLDDGTSSASSFVVIWVKQGDQWLIDSLTETEVPQNTAHTALQELSWLVGTWEDETEEILVRTSCKWSRTGTFLIRSFHVERSEEDTTEGTQIIGWDPLMKQLRSWTFYSDGSFGSGYWSKSGSEWLVKSSQVMADGRIAQGTYVFSDITPDSMSVQLTGYSIEGELQPARQPVLVVRVDETSETSEPEASPAAEGGQPE